MKRHGVYKITLIIVIVCVLIVFLCAVIWKYREIPAMLDEKYQEAVTLYESGFYYEARKAFNQLGNYKDSMDYLANTIRKIKYNDAKELIKEKKYQEAVAIFEALGNFEDSAEQAKEAQYKYAKSLYDAESYEEAFTAFQKQEGYKDSSIYLANITVILQEKMEKRLYEEAERLYNEREYQKALDILEKIVDYELAAELEQKCKDAINRRKLATTVSAGQRYSVRITQNGGAESTGSSSYGEGNVDNWNNIVSIAGQGCYTIGLMDNGKVVVAGSSYGDTVDTSEWEDIIAVDAGELFVVGLKSDGTVEASGHRGDGQTDVKGSEWVDIVAIATGWRHTVGLDSSGEIHITGFNAENQLKQIRKSGEWHNIIAIAAGGGGKGDVIGRGHTVGLREDGHVVAVGDNEWGQCNVEDWENIVAIAAGQWHTVGLKCDGSVVATGYDGKDDFYSYKNACAVEDWKNIVAIAAGSGYTIGIDRDGNVHSVGYDDDGKRTNMEGWKVPLYKEMQKERVNSFIFHQ